MSKEEVELPKIVKIIKIKEKEKCKICGRNCDYDIEHKQLLEDIFRTSDEYEDETFTKIYYKKI